MTTYAVFFLAALLAMHDRIAAVLSWEWAAGLVHALYWILPKTAQLGQAVVGLVGGEEIARHAVTSLNPTTFLTTGAFAVGCLVLASWRFARKDF